MIPEVIQVKSPSGDKACVQSDGTFLSNCIHDQYPCSSMLLHIVRCCIVCIMMYCVIVPVLSLGPLTAIINTSPDTDLGLEFQFLS
jgi:hypothetical protein